MINVRIMLPLKKRYSPTHFGLVKVPGKFKKKLISKKHFNRETLWPARTKEHQKQLFTFKSLQDIFGLFDLKRYRIIREKRLGMFLYLKALGKL